MKAKNRFLLNLIYINQLQEGVRLVLIIGKITLLLELLKTPTLISQESTYQF